MRATPIIGQDKNVKRSLALTSAFGLATLSLLAFAPYGMAQREVALMDPAEAQAQLERATRASQSAQARAERFERERLGAAPPLRGLALGASGGSGPTTGEPTRRLLTDPALIGGKP